jgi:capsule biosynthesis phosphatase
LVIQSENVIIFDVDGTICELPPNCTDYSKAVPFKKMIKKIQEYKTKGYYIILTTSRNMRTYEGNIGKIMANTAPTLIKWLADQNVVYDEIHFGKPWCGKNGFYVDDKAIRPTEFVNLSFDEITAKLNSEMKEWKKMI